jgi:hypothetical protein
MNNPASEPTPDTPLPAKSELLLTAAVERLLQSRVLSRSAQLKRLLGYLRDATEAGDDGLLSETAIGVNVFHRADFNPKVDTIVRSEMVRLRRKLDEFYQGEGAGEPVCLSIDKNVYRLLVATQLPGKPHPAAVAQRPFWLGLAIGLVASGLVAVAALAVWGVGPRRDMAQPALLRSPLWSGFRNANVDVLEGSALFFKNLKGYERNWSLNYAADIPGAKAALGNWPALPAWDKWAAFDDVSTAVGLDRFLRQLNANATFQSARGKSVGNLGKRHTIVFGHPRFAPLLAELLADQDFRAPVAGEQNGSGFVNARPLAGELDRYFNPLFEADTDRRDNFLLSQADESVSDYGLVTSLRLKEGGEVLSIFGDRTESASVVVQSLTTPAFLEELDARVFGRSGRRYKSAQIVVRIDYTHGKPIGVVYLTHRVHY